MQLFTKKADRLLKKQKQSEVLNKDPKDVKIASVIFDPIIGNTWYVFGVNDKNKDILWCYANLCDPDNAEIGTVSRNDLENQRTLFDMKMERDQAIKPGSMSLQEAMDIVRNNK